jgi:copper resistance protein B
MKPPASVLAALLSVLVAGGAASAEAQPVSKPAQSSAPADPHAGHRVHSNASEPSQDLPPFIPRLTDEDRRAAFPDVDGHATHDRAIHYLAQFDQLEWQARDGVQGLNLDARGWVGGDLDRLWFRLEGSTEETAVEDAQLHLLYGRKIARWWDLVAGVRQDFRPGDPQTWAAVGIQGLAPYWFDVEVTGYVGPSGRTRARLAVEYELLLTNRLVVQPLVELEMAGTSDPERGVGAGLSTSDAGFRVRYEIRRELAPYVGVTWNRTWGRTADYARAAGEPTGGARLVTGLRLWF